MERGVGWKIEAETRQLLLQLWRRPERSQLSVAIVGECGSTQTYFRRRHTEVKGELKLREGRAAGRGSWGSVEKGETKKEVGRKVERNADSWG